MWIRPRSLNPAPQLSRRREMPLELRGVPRRVLRPIPMDRDRPLPYPPPHAAHVIEHQFDTALKPRRSTTTSHLDQHQHDEAEN